MDDPDIPLAPTLQGGVDAPIRTLPWRELALAGDKESSKEWHRRLLDSGLLVQGSRDAADRAEQPGDPRRDIVRVQREMRELMRLEDHYAEVNQPGPWNSGGVRIGATSILILLGLLYLTGIRHHGPVGTASLLCLVAVGAMWGDIFRRRREAVQTWTRRNEVRARLRAAVVRLGTRSWVAPLGREVLEITPHLDLVGMWKREVRQHLAPWQAKLDALAPLEAIDGLPQALIDEAHVDVDPAEEREARVEIGRLTGVLEKLDGLEAELTASLDRHRRLAATGQLPDMSGMSFDLEEVRGWLRSAGIDPARSGQNAQEWLDQGG